MVISCIGISYNILVTLECHNNENIIFCLTTLGYKASTVHIGILPNNNVVKFVWLNILLGINQVYYRRYNCKAQKHYDYLHSIF